MAIRLQGLALLAMVTVSGAADCHKSVAQWKQTPFLAQCWHCDATFQAKPKTVNITGFVAEPPMRTLSLTFTCPTCGETCMESFTERACERVKLTPIEGPVLPIKVAAKHHRQIKAPKA